jgi:MraZ protein
LPQRTLEMSNITKEAVIIGVGDHLEIWEPKNYDKYLSDSDDKLEQAAEGMTKND